MKRRNLDSGGKPRRSFKRCNKLTDGSSSFLGSFVYLKMFLIWCTILLVDFILEFRFEYLWPFWLMVRSIGNCMKYQGMVVAVFFACFNLVSDAICFFVIPMHMLFFLASTYVWVRYVWNADRGICMPTITLWLLFVYIEVSVRLKDLQKNSLQVDLCRPLAAHCVGYPIVALSSGFKNYVQYRFRLRKQFSVRLENDFLFELIRNALPKQEETQEIAVKDSPTSNKEEENTGYSMSIMNSPNSKKNNRHSNGSVPMLTTPEPSSAHDTSGVKLRKRNSTSSLPSPSQVQSKSSTKKEQQSSIQVVNDIKGISNTQPIKEEPVKRMDSPTPKPSPPNHVSEMPDVLTPIFDKQLQEEKESQPNGKAADSVTTKNNNAMKFEKLDSMISDLRSELNMTRQCETMLRTQNFTLTNAEKTTKNELNQMRRDNEQLQSKLHNLVSMKQKDKQIIESLENQLKTETMSRLSTERMLQDEKVKRMEEEAKNAAVVNSNKKTQNCPANSYLQTWMDHEKNEENRKYLEVSRKECEQLKKQVLEKDEYCQLLQKEVEEFRQKEKSVRESETLMSALAAMQEKNAMLEKSLSAETRLKLDLFSALGDVKRQLEISHSIRCQREVEIQELQARVADVLSVLPDSQPSPATPHYSTTFLESRPVPPQQSLHMSQPQHYSPAFCPLSVTPVPPQQPIEPRPMLHHNTMVQTSNILNPPLSMDPGMGPYAPSSVSSVQK